MKHYVTENNIPQTNVPTNRILPKEAIYSITAGSYSRIFLVYLTLIVISKLQRYQSQSHRQNIYQDKLAQ